MWLVLEGIDGAGKTTIANKLAEKHTQYRVVNTGPPGLPADFKGRPVKEVAERIGGSFHEMALAWSREQSKHVIWDRGHLGNWVYQQDEDRMSVAEMRLLEAVLINHNGVTVLVNTDPRIAFGRQSDNASQEDLIKESIQFQQACHELKSYWVDTTVKGALTLFEDWQKYDEVRHMDDEGVGTNSPSIWLLGEQRNPQAEIQVPFSSTAGLRLVWPWVNPMAMRVSNVLRPEADLERARGGMFSGETTRDLYFRWVTLGKPRVITFGVTARDACEEAGVPVGLNLEHPSHVWRFQQAEAEAWRDRAALRVGMIA